MGSPRPPEAAAEAAMTLLNLSAPSNVTNLQAIATITLAPPAAASVTASAAFLDGILLPSPTRKTKKTSHQKQIDRHAQTHKRQEAIVVACTAGKHFFQWGEGCMLRWTMKAREAEVTEKEKERKQRKEFHERREAALIVLDRLKHELDGDVD